MLNSRKPNARLARTYGRAQSRDTTGIPDHCIHPLYTISAVNTTYHSGLDQVDKAHLATAKIDRASISRPLNTRLPAIPFIARRDFFDFIQSHITWRGQSATSRSRTELHAVVYPPLLLLSFSLHPSIL